jgi:hypothetical protein
MGVPKPLPPMTPADVARFWPKVTVGKPNECWEWQGAKQGDYGAFQLAGRAVKAHRVAYFLATGQNPLAELTCHSCDNPPCCNPSHLFLGDNLANQRDCIEKGRKRSARGEQIAQHILNEDDVREIRALYESGEHRQDALALRFGVSRRAISAIVTGQTWKHVPVLLQQRRRVT